MRCGKSALLSGYVLSFRVATRTNALWQIVGKDVATALGYSRNPHECAVANLRVAGKSVSHNRRNPHECAVANMSSMYVFAASTRRNPHECAVANFLIAENGV